MKIYSQSPLPFQGQKRRFYKEFKQALNEFQKASLFVDLFGGSGLLSRWVKDAIPSATVIYNDYDNYSKRIANVEQTNTLLAVLRDLTIECPQDKIIRKEVKEQILQAIKAQEIETGYVDYITISSSLLFSMKYALNFEDMSKQTMYNCIRKNDYEPALDYLQGIDVVCMDYRELFDRWKHVDGAVFLVDPPYLSTDCTTYSSYWRLGNYLDVLHTLHNTNYFYFTSNKSSILELTEWIEKNLKAENPFSGAIKIEANATMNKSAGYTDIMLYKHV